MTTRHCAVGILSEVLAFLREKVKSEDCSHSLDVALIFDSMAIRKEIVYDKTVDVHRGYVDVGGIADIDRECLATEALVFQIVSFTKHFCCPVAYFLVDKIKAEIQAQLLLAVISELSEIGITVRSLTCHGAVLNLKTYELLGCELNPESLQSHFDHPQRQSRIHCILEPCHMIKLCRNAFAEVKLNCKRDGSILFSYIRKLNDLQE